MDRKQIGGLVFVLGALVGAAAPAQAQSPARFTALTANGVAIQGDKGAPGVVLECVDFEGIDVAVPAPGSKPQVSAIVCKHRVDAASARLLDAMLKNLVIGGTVSFMWTGPKGSVEPLYTITFKNGRLTALRNSSDATGVAYESFEISLTDFTVTHPPTKVTVVRQP